MKIEYNEDLFFKAVMILIALGIAYSFLGNLFIILLVIIGIVFLIFKFNLIEKIKNK